MLPDPAGIEPVTSWSPVKCALDWATEAGTTIKIVPLKKRGLLYKDENSFLI